MFFPQYKSLQMRVLYRAMCKIFFVESWLHLYLISFRTVNLKIQVLNLAYSKIHFEKCVVNCSETGTLGRNICECFNRWN